MHNIYIHISYNTHISVYPYIDSHRYTDTHAVIWYSSIVNNKTYWNKIIVLLLLIRPPR